jgi:hypothetical protein
MLSYYGCFNGMHALWDVACAMRLMMRGFLEDYLAHGARLGGNDKIILNDLSSFIIFFLLIGGYGKA